MRVERLERRHLLSGFTSYLGGSGDDESWDSFIDSAGNAYIVGNTASSDFPTTAGAWDTSPNGGKDAFVTKFDPNGNLLWSTVLGGSGLDLAEDVAVDASGHVYVTGSTTSANFPVTVGAYQTSIGTTTAFGNAFVTKLDPSGGSLVYSTFLGGSGSNRGLRITVDATDNVFVSGNTESGFPTTAGAYQTTYGGGIVDAFVSKLDSTGASLVYSTYLGGTSSDWGGLDIVVDATGHAYVGGSSRGSFPTTPGAFQTSDPGFGDNGVVSKLSPDGSSLIYSTYFGGNNAKFFGGEGVFGIALKPSGNLMLTGRTTSTNLPTTPGVVQSSHGGDWYDIFIAELTSDGSDIVFATYLGGAGRDDSNGSRIALDSSNNIYVSAGTNSTNFPTTVDAAQTTNNGGYDAFLTKLNPTGTAILYSTYLGGSGNEFGYGLAVTAAGSVIITGASLSSDLPVTADAYDTTFNGGSDAFVARIDLIDNAEPEAVDDSYSVPEDGALNVAAVDGVLANDSDPDSDPLSVSLLSGPDSGAVSLNADGSFTYVPFKDFSGTDEFSYEISDGNGGFDSAVVVINVLSAQAQIDVAATDIEALVSAEILNEGQGNALLSKLNNAQAKLDKGNTKSAINQLKAFQNQVQALIKSGILDEEEGSDLIALIQAAIVSVG